MFLRQCGNHTLAFFFDFFREPGMPLLDKAGCQAEFQQGHGKSRRQVVEIRAYFCELHGFDGLVVELLYRIVQFVIKQLRFFHGVQVLKSAPIVARFPVVTAYNGAMKVIVCAVAALLLCAAAVMLAPDAGAQNYPNRTVRIVVPISAGGATDVFARTLAIGYTEAWNQQVIVDNRPGAGGMIGSEMVAKAVPDGYTLLMGNVAPNAVNVSLFKKLGFDPVKDFSPVSLVAITPNILVAHPSQPVKTVKELLALAKAKPGALNFPSAGVGSSSHLAGELLKSLAKIDMVHVPFKGGGPALVAMISGEVQIMFATMPAAMPHVKSGKARAIAVTTSKRSQAMPELPTIAEAGVTGYEASTWYGLLAPAKTPKPVVDRLHADTVKILAGPARQRLEIQGFEPVGGTPAEFSAYIKSEIVKWAKVIKDANIPAE